MHAKIRSYANVSFKKEIFNARLYLAFTYNISFAIFNNVKIILFIRKTILINNISLE